MWEVSISPVDSLQALEAEWTDLESRSSASFFQTWGWIGSWVEALPEDHRPDVLRVEYDATLVALALVRRTRARRRRVISSRTLFINETGDPEIDGIAIEHNGFLVAEQRSPDALAEIVSWLNVQGDTWDEVVISGMDHDVARQYGELAQEQSCIANYADPKPYYYVDLDALRQDGKTYIESLGKNTRYQLRRSMRKYAPDSSVECSSPENLHDALETFERLRVLHDTYWHAKGLPGAFGTDFRRRLHAGLIERCFDKGHVEFIEVTAAGKPIGYLYNFRYRGRVMNYQSGFAYGDDPHLKPGLVTHAMAIQRCLEGDTSVYDFLMGNLQYKRSLSNGAGEMVKLVVQQPRLKFRAEAAAKSIKARFSDNDE